MSEEPTKPLLISTKIPIVWLLVVAFALGVWQASESLARSSYETSTNMRLSSVERNVESIQNNIESLHQMTAKTCLDVAVIQNDQRHIIVLLEELKTDIRGLKDARTVR